MDRRAFIGGLAGGLLAVPLAAEGQQAKTPPRIGFILMGSSQAGLTSAFDAFGEGLRELGWTENENIAIEYRWAGESPHRLPELAADLVRLKVDIIIGSTPGVRAAQHATTSIPIIMRPDPEGGQARRPPRRAADEVRVGHQPQDCEGAGVDDPAVGAGAGG